MEVILKNIQSIEEGCYTFPDVGLVQILGDNSNGKSILIKVISAIASMKILDEDERRALINDNVDEGSITIQYKSKILIVKLHEDRNKCVVALIRNKEEKIIRTFRDGGIEELLDEFGFRVYNKNAICLQIYETFGQMPFVNTTVGVNYEMIDAITTDTVAQTFLTNFKEVTHKKAKERVKNIDIKLEGLRKAKTTLILFDHEAYENIGSKMREVYNILKYLEPIELEFVHIPPKVNLIDIKPPRLEQVKFVTPLPVIEKIPSLYETLADLKKISEGKCPTCGKALIDSHIHEEVL